MSIKQNEASRELLSSIRIIVQKFAEIKCPSLVNSKGVLLLYNNVRSHIAHITQGKDYDIKYGSFSSFSLLSWCCSIWPIIILDHCNIFYREKYFNNEEFETNIVSFFALKPEQFYTWSINNVQIDEIMTPIMRGYIILIKYINTNIKNVSFLIWLCCISYLI